MSKDIYYTEKLNAELDDMKMVQGVCGGKTIFFGILTLSVFFGEAKEMVRMLLSLALSTATTLMFLATYVQSININHHLREFQNSRSPDIEVSPLSDKQKESSTSKTIKK